MSHADNPNVVAAFGSAMAVRPNLLAELLATPEAEQAEFMLAAAEKWEAETTIAGILDGLEKSFVPELSQDEKVLFAELTIAYAEAVATYTIGESAKVQGPSGKSRITQYVREVELSDGSKFVAKRVWPTEK